MLQVKENWDKWKSIVRTQSNYLNLCQRTSKHQHEMEPYKIESMQDALSARFKNISYFYKNIDRRK